MDSVVAQQSRLDFLIADDSLLQQYKGTVWYTPKLTARLRKEAAP